MTLKSTLKDGLVIALGIIIIISLFSLQGWMETWRKNIQDKEILTGRQIMIDSPGAGDIIIGNGEDKKPKENKPDTTKQEDPNIKCLMDGGLTDDDVQIGGNFFKGIECPEKKKDVIKAEIREHCVNVNVGQELDTKICIENRGMLNFGLEIPKQPEKAAGKPINLKNYNGLALFVMFLITLLLVWREFEVKERKRKEWERIREKHVELPGEHIEVRVIKSAPLFKEIVSEEEKLLTHEEMIEVHEKLVREQKAAMEAKPLTTEEISECIKSFNAIGKDITEELKHGNLDKARRKFLLLFPIYTRLYNSLDEMRKRDLVDVIKYLHDQLNIMEKSRKIRHLIEEVYQHAEQHRVDKEPVEKTSEENKEIEKAAKVFSQLGGETEKEKIEKKDVLEGIEKMRESLIEGRTAEKKASNELRDELEKLKKLVYGEKTKGEKKQGKQKD